MENTPSAPEWSSITKPKLLASLASSAAQITVLTPNARLAQALAAEFDAAQVQAGKSVWETADILPFSSYVERAYQDALHDDRAESAALPVLLTPAQEQALWEETIAASSWGNDLLALAPAAAEAGRAWLLAHQWRIADEALKSSPRFPRNEDAEAFAQWAAQYKRRCERERHIDAARLPDVVMKVAAGGDRALPTHIVAYAFDILPPQTRALFDTLARRGVEVLTCAPEHREGRVLRWPFPSARAELQAAARWARATLESAGLESATNAEDIASQGAGNGPSLALTTAMRDAPSRKPVRIGIVVPDLGQRRKEVARVLSQTLNPGATLPGAPQDDEPLFNLSLGLPLSEYPLVHAALGLIELTCGEVPFALASRLVRSPFIGGSQSEQMPRARLDAALRREVSPELTLARLLAALHGTSRAAATAQSTPLLLERLDAMLRQVREGQQSRPPQGADRGTERAWTERLSAPLWAERFAALLAAAGFPGERALDSAEYQTHVKWTEALAEFARLGRVLAPLSAREASARLSRLVTATSFQPQSGGAPVQVLGILESDGLAFDHLWVCGLTDEAWPLPARPHPFLPLVLQKVANIPEASAEGALALDRRITANWLGAADEVVLSHPLATEDRELSPSPLIAGVPEGQLQLPDYASYRDTLFAARALEFFPAHSAGERAPALAPVAEAGGKTSGGEIRGGASVLSDQSACPFRAFARHRMEARPLEEPAPGLDAAARGTLLHALMKGVWDRLKSKAALDAMPREELRAVIAQAAQTAVASVRRHHSIGDAFAELEQQRLARIAIEWLELERKRPDFEVAASEEDRTLHGGDLTLAGRIDRLDRLDSGGYALIDYKSGTVTPKSWLGDRPDDPQLPLYAVSATEPIDAVIFAKLKTGSMRMMGFSREERMVPGVQKFHDWNGLIEGWRRETTALGTAFMAGEAEVDPKKGAQTCRLCALAPLCRVHEKFAALDDEDDVPPGEGGAA